MRWKLVAARVDGDDCWCDGLLSRSSATRGGKRVVSQLKLGLLEQQTNAAA